MSPGVGEQAGKDGFLGNAPVADDANLVDGLRAVWAKAVPTENSQDKQDRKDAPGRARIGRLPGDGSVLDLHRVGVLRRAQVLVRSKVRLHGKNMHTLIA